MQDEYLTKSEVGGKETAARYRVVVGKHPGLLERGLVALPRLLVVLPHHLNRSEDRVQRHRATIVFPCRLARPVASI